MNTSEHKNHDNYEGQSGHDHDDIITSFLGSRAEMIFAGLAGICLLTGWLGPKMSILPSSVGFILIIATWIGLVGWAILVHHILVTILLTLWGLMYVFAPIFEEPWLEERYGELYLNYKRSTPRFFWKI